MSKAHVDPVELRRFASDLVRFNDEQDVALRGLNAKLSGLEATWRDQEQKKFRESFEQVFKIFGKFLDESREHVKILNQKATAIEAYLKKG
jgi:uncharacterized protein YukE